MVPSGPGKSTVRTAPTPVPSTPSSVPGPTSTRWAGAHSEIDAHIAAAEHAYAPVCDAEYAGPPPAFFLSSAAMCATGSSASACTVGKSAIHLV